jgi:hypothetical protein
MGGDPDIFPEIQRNRRTNQQTGLFGTILHEKKKHSHNNAIFQSFTRLNNPT